MIFRTTLVSCMLGASASFCCVHNACVARASSLALKMARAGTTETMAQDFSSRPQVLALDFDGVVCASSGESSYTSILAACDFWSGHLNIPPGSKEFKQIQDAVHSLRPIVETGYENMLLVRALYDELVESKGCVNPDMLMKAWSPAMRDRLLKEYGSDKDTMVRAFGEARDKLITKDILFWVQLNEIYPWAQKAMGNLHLKGQSFLDYSIVTTKQARFVQAILTQNNIAPPPSAKLFDLENPFGSKKNVLQAMLRGLPADSNKVVADSMQSVPLLEPAQRPFIHFVEDRVETLIAILESKELRENTKLYLVEHGYNTPEQRNLGKSYSEISVIGPNEFQQLVSSFQRPQ